MLSAENFNCTPANKKCIGASIFVLSSIEKISTSDLHRLALPGSNAGLLLAADRRKTGLIWVGLKLVSRPLGEPLKPSPHKDRNVSPSLKKIQNACLLYSRQPVLICNNR